MTVVATPEGDWMERPPEEVMTYGEQQDADTYNDESSSLTNSCDEERIPFATDVRPIPLAPPYNNEEWDRNPDDFVPTERFIRDEPSSLIEIAHSRRQTRMTLTTYLAAGLSFLAVIICTTPSLCSTVGVISGKSDHSFCLFHTTEDLNEIAKEAKLTNFLNSISLAGKVDRSLVRAMLRRGDLELPWDADRIRQRYALGTLLGEEFVKYEDECGVTLNNGDVKSIVCDEDGMVSELRLSDLKLIGTIPEDIGLLSNKLRVLKITYAKHAGTLPIQAISVLTKLTHLDLSNNKLSGTISEALGSLKLLSSLNLSNNALHGQVPSDLCNLALLRVLHLAQNRLSGTFPNCAWKDMEAMYLDGNKFSGPLPSSLGVSTNLQQLNMAANGFIGTIPKSWSGLTNLEVFSISNNKLDGDFTKTIQHWPNVQSLDISENDITGYIPAEVCHWRNLLQFLSSNTRVSGTLPSCIGSWTKLEDFDIYQTSIEGTLPTEIGHWVDLKSFSIARTSICGEIPEQISEWKGIERAWFDETSLEGIMPLCHSTGRLGRGRSRSLDSLGADCDKVFCPCCRACL